MNVVSNEHIVVTLFRVTLQVQAKAKRKKVRTRMLWLPRPRLFATPKISLI